MASKQPATPTSEKPVEFVRTDGRTRMVASVAGAVNANADGFYHPDTPSGKFAKSKAPKAAPARRRTTQRTAAKTPSVNREKGTSGNEDTQTS